MKIMHKCVRVAAQAIDLGPRLLQSAIVFLRVSFSYKLQRSARFRLTVIRNTNEMIVAAVIALECARMHACASACLTDNLKVAIDARRHENGTLNIGDFHKRAATL